MFSAVQIAEWFVRKGIQSGRPLDLLQIMKLAYIAHGCYLALQDKPLFREKVEAWQYGPVVPSIYDEYRKHGKFPITYSHDCFDLSRLNQNEICRKILDYVYKVFSDLTSSELIRLTHKKGSPWSIVYKEGLRGIVIDNTLIKDYYQTVMQVK